MGRLTPISLFLLLLARVCSAQIGPAAPLVIPCADDKDYTNVVQNTFNTAMNTGQTVELPGGRCRTDNFFWSTTAAGFYGNGGTFDATHNGGYAFGIYSVHNGSNYDGNVKPWSNFNLIGPGRNTGSTAFTVAASNWGLAGFNISGFGTGIAIGNYGYGDNFSNGELWGNGMDVFCPNGGQLTDAGEQLNFTDVSLFNSGIGFGNGSCQFNFKGGSMDFMSNYTGYACSPVLLDGVNVEGFNHGPLFYACGGNTAGHLVVTDSHFISEGNYTIPVFSGGSGGPYVDARGNYFSGVGGDDGTTYLQGAGRLCDSTRLGNAPFTISNVGPC